MRKSPVFTICHIAKSGILMPSLRKQSSGACCFSSSSAMAKMHSWPLMMTRMRSAAASANVIRLPLASQGCHVFIRSCALAMKSAEDCSVTQAPSCRTNVFALVRRSIQHCFTKASLGNDSPETPCTANKIATSSCIWEMAFPTWWNAFLMSSGSGKVWVVANKEGLKGS